MTKDRSPHALDLAIGQRIRERRRAIGLTQQELAEAIGITFQQVQKYERGMNRVSFSRLAEIAHTLRCGLSDLAQGLEVSASRAELERCNHLLALEGALPLLEAYAALPVRVRRTLLEHARRLREALAASQAENP